MAASTPLISTTQRALAQCRAARRLARLFRIERHGGFDRRPADVAQRLVERRGTIIAELLALALAPPGSPLRSAELDSVLRDLAVEVEHARLTAQQRHDTLDSELHFRRGESPTGIRNGAGGQLLGRG
ncbi:MAG TPA: hypothetical protein VHY35_04760 [Stellaceae bacterium]|jgi:hypothetical protein|nr:hypothetical protein [Stellaceae bacterium]